MRKLFTFVVLLAVGLAVVGYWRGWYNVTSEDGKLHLGVDAEKFHQDREGVSKTAAEEAGALKEKIAGLLKQTKDLTGPQKAAAEKELAELQQKQARLEKQIQELNQTGKDRFEDIKADLSKNLGEVNQKIQELQKKLEKTNDQ